MERIGRVSRADALKIFPNSSCFISLVLSVIREDENRRKIERCIGKICNSKQNPQKEQMSARLSRLYVPLNSHILLLPSLSYLRHLEKFPIALSNCILVRNLSLCASC